MPKWPHLNGQYVRINFDKKIFFYTYVSFVSFLENKTEPPGKCMQRIMYTYYIIIVIIIVFTRYQLYTTQSTVNFVIYII